MDALVRDGLGGEPVYANGAACSESPAKLLFLALTWLLTATAAGFATAVLVGIAVILRNKANAAGATDAWTMSPADYGLVAMVVMIAVLLLASLGRADIVGRGSVRAGLGDGPIRRPGLLAALAILGEVAIFGWLVLLLHWLQPGNHNPIVVLMQNAHAAGGWMQVTTLLCMAVLSPLWEEMFFRGWLWTGLRRHWRPLPVMVATALPWLLLHMADGLLRPLFLIPAAIIFSLARHYCGGVRASLTLHMLNNLIAVSVMMIALAHAHP